MTIDTSKIIIEGGGYSGRPLTQVPAQYLRRLSASGSYAEAAREELKRRGTPYKDYTVEISNHAIDRFSLHDGITVWEKRRKDGEGLFTFILRTATEALLYDNRDGKGRFIHNGMKWVFDFRPETPVLVTVMKKDGSRFWHAVNERRGNDGYLGTD